MNNEVFDQLKEKAEAAEAIGGTLKFEVGDQIVYVDGAGNSNIVSQYIVDKTFDFRSKNQYI